MVYPATTKYLIMKLNWMARKQKKMNTPTTIIEWNDAMQSVFKTLEDFSRNKELSTPTEMTKTKREYCRGPSICVKPSNNEALATDMILMKNRRPVAKGFRSQPAKKPRLASKVEVSEENNPKQRDTKKEVSMEVDNKDKVQNGDISKLDAEREEKLKGSREKELRSSKMKVKEVWARALSRKVRRDGNEFLKRNEETLQDWCTSVSKNDSKFKEQLQLNFPGRKTEECLKLLNWDELKECLRYLLDTDL